MQISVLTIFSIIFAFIFVLIVFQIKFIMQNTTTSEELRKDKTSIPDFDTGSASKNCADFNNEIFHYKAEVNYNEGATLLLSKNIMLVQYEFNEEKRKSSMVNFSNYNTFIKEIKLEGSTVDTINLA